eukprot:CAMPEP_0168334046 /NCGR_PEP_ID=MMETSP0213-20121227/10004_1 /TAXON_ID=151035 /ORGANISM="Euplotes harpa, Strain FSP1.4" /LENGTH=44 /DNA_ID= /DNA_START= /DNA_END= /DNA_ORIENTATION=
MSEHLVKAVVSDAWVDVVKHAPEDNKQMKIDENEHLLFYICEDI